MNGINSLVLEGELSEISTQKNGEVSVTTLKLCVTRTIKGLSKIESYCFDVECYGHLAETLEVQFEEGRGVRIVGRLSQSSSLGSDGKTHLRTFIIAEHIDFKPRKTKTEK